MLLCPSFFCDISSPPCREKKALRYRSITMSCSDRASPSPSPSRASPRTGETRFSGASGRRPKTYGEKIGGVLGVLSHRATPDHPVVMDDRG